MSTTGSEPVKSVSSVPTEANSESNRSRRRFGWLVVSTSISSKWHRWPTLRCAGSWTTGSSGTKRRRRPRKPEEVDPRLGEGSQVPAEDRPGRLRHQDAATHGFIEDGHKVKVTLQFRGREMAHPELGSQDPRRRDRGGRPGSQGREPSPYGRTQHVAGAGTGQEGARGHEEDSVGSRAANVPVADAEADQEST